MLLVGPCPMPNSYKEGEDPPSFLAPNIYFFALSRTMLSCSQLSSVINSFVRYVIMVSVEGSPLRESIKGGFEV